MPVEYRAFGIPSSRSMVAASIMLLIVFGFINLAFGQIFPKTHSSNINSPSTLFLTHSQKRPYVKITFPIKGQQVPADKDLVVFGTSSSNTHTNLTNCRVSVIVNGIKPYQPARGIGPGGSNDYSRWNFKLTQTYTIIREGQNKITAKYTCPNFASSFHNSVNVTGVTNANISTAPTNRNTVAALNETATNSNDDLLSAYHTGISLLNLSKYNESITAFDKALAINPNYLYALYSKGSALLSLGKYNESITAFDKALAINPNYLYALYSKGAALSKLGKYSESISYFDKSLKVDPTYSLAINYKKLDFAALKKTR